MVIKKFVGKTEEEATALAKKELGENVVIMNVRPVKRTGLLSFLKAQKTEVTVALEEDSAPRAHARGFSAVADDAKTPKTPPMPSMAGIARAAQSGQIPPLKVSGAESAHPASEKAQPPHVVQPAAREPEPETKSGASVIEEKLDNLHSLLEQRIISPQGAETGIAKAQKSAPQTVEEKTEQAAELSSRPAKPAVSEEEKKAQDEKLSFIKLLYNTLLENEVDERYANELIDDVEKLSKPNMSLDYALRNVYERMVLKFGRPEVIEPSPDGRLKAEIFIGPTGVGKTTTIAKLASKLHLTDRKKVALLTVDTYRIAAAEQLRTYASIMEAPFRVIYSVEEMKQAISDFRDYDYLMIDTAGHAVHNEEQKDNIAAFIRAIAEEADCENYLVLSATTKYRDLIGITDAYSAMVQYRLLFTKMDETHATGNLYNIRMHTGAPMSYITNGQDVPDDIEVFNAQKIVKGLLGGKRSERYGSGHPAA